MTHSEIQHLVDDYVRLSERCALTVITASFQLRHPCYNQSTYPTASAFDLIVTSLGLAMIQMGASAILSILVEESQVRNSCGREAAEIWDGRIFLYNEQQSISLPGIFLQFEGWGMSLPMDQKYQVPTLRHGSHYRLRHTQPVQLLPLLRLPKGLTLRVLDDPSSVTHGGSSTSAASALWHKAQDGPTIPSARTKNLKDHFASWGNASNYDLT
ncbi:hypothetical protein MG293_011393 [Ovis ammon polii]|uniref:Uncharacterized protein n=1 Tax=Ovis ammon polii TaxID=230172 RepID=A0AAD4U5K6_OVIAM|nr:hypothetical protein MG293_011393 [Ovis ammon polii]